MSRLELCHVCLCEGPEARLIQDPSLRVFFTDVIRLSDVLEQVLVCAWCAMSVRKAITVYENAACAAPVLRWLRANIYNEVMVDNTIISLAQSQQKMLHSLVRTEINVEVISEGETTHSVDPLELTNEERNNVTVKTIKREFDIIDDCEENVFEDNICDGLTIFEKISQMREDKSSKENIQNYIEGKSSKTTRKKRKNQSKGTVIKNKQRKGTVIKNKQRKGTVIKKKQPEATTSKHVNTKKTERKNENSEVAQFQVVYLSVQEQVQEILDRRNSEKYLKSKLQCKACGLGFVGKDVYSKHMQRHKEAFGLYKCDICTLHFKTSEVLLQHTLAHRRYYRCNVCSAIVRRRCHCSEHRAKCGGTAATLRCDICSKMFKDPFSLKKHAREVHVNAKLYECNYCSKNFGNKQKLVIHIRSHTGEKPYDCEICNKKFATSSNMRAHSAVHRIVPKYYYCVKCNVYCKTAKYLNKHFKSVMHQGGVFRYSCTDCQMQFLSVTRLDDHIRNIHRGERCYSCHICAKRYSRNGNLNKHIRTVHRTEESL